MPLIYLDTSAFLRRFKLEAGSTGVRALFELAEVEPTAAAVLVTSGWTLNEAAGVLRREHHKGRFSLSEMRLMYAAILRETRRLVIARILRLEGPDFALCRQAAAFTIDKAYRPPDALQLSTALAAKCDVFLATDAKLLKAASREGLKTIDSSDDIGLSTWLSSV
jgi:predicted nucleic acid-binding protein